MKRSEMINILVELLDSEEMFESNSYEKAKLILDKIEIKGMLPPSRINDGIPKTLSNLHHLVYKELDILDEGVPDEYYVCLWEKENE